LGTAIGNRNWEPQFASAIGNRNWEPQLATAICKRNWEPQFATESQKYDSTRSAIMASVTQEIVVAAPIGQVFAYWKNFENFPQFMENIESVEVIGPEKTHWKAKGPLGIPVEWDAETTYIEENKKIAWKSTEGTIETHGAVVFHELGSDSTRVTVGLEYNPPAGALGEAVAKLVQDPAKQLEEDLERFKSVAEDRKFEFATGATGADGTAGSDHTAG